MAKRPILIILAGLAVAGLVAGCATQRPRSKLAGPDWSRGVQVGECSVNDLVALYAEPDGERVHLAWGRVSTAGDHLRYVQLDGRAQVAQDHALSVAVRSPRQVRLVPDGEEGLILCYLSGVSEGRRLFALHLDRSGQPLGEAVQVPGPELEVDEYALVPSARGAEVFWSHNARATRGLYHVALDHSGRALAPSQLIVEGGISPDARIDRQGKVHLAWVHEPGYFEENVYYAVFDPEARALGSPLRVGFFLLNPRATRFGPVVGLESDRAYVLWSWEHLVSGATTTAGEAECRYVAIPFGASEEPQERTLALPASARPPYAPARGAYAYTQLAPAGAGMSGLIYMPSPVAGQHQEVATVVGFQASTRTRSYLQIGVVYLAGGEVKGYQAAARGGQVLMRPGLETDGEGHLHLAWLEPAGINRYQVYYASTRPGVRAALGRLGQQDVVEAAYEVAWRAAQMMSMFPIGIVWLFLPLVWVIGYYVVRPDGQLDMRGPRIALGIAIAIYLFSKYFLLPAGFMEAAPFVDRVSPAAADAIRFGLPAGILAVALGALGLYVRRAEDRSLFGAYFVFAATDALVTFIFYAPGVLGG